MTHEEWLERRRKGIGGSDSPVLVLGKDHPFTTPRQLWEDKLGLSKPVKETSAMQRGTVLEPVIADLYAEATGRKLRKSSKQYKSKDHPFMVGNIDRQIIHSDKGPGILEIKCPGWRTFSKIKREGLSNYYQIQLQHYLYVTGRQWGAFAVFNPDAWELIQFDVERDEKLISLIIKKCTEFWKLVQSGTPPQDEVEQIELPPLKADTDLVEMDSAGWNQAVEDYLSASEIFDEAKEMVDDAKERMKNLMEVQKAEVAEGHGLRAYYRERAGRKTFDHKAFMAAHPEIDVSSFFKQGKNIKSFRPYITGGKK